MRQIVLDTETTGLEPSQGHKIIEIGCVELVDRRLTGKHYHQYIKPMREIDQGAMDVHGITNEFLNDKPVFSQIAKEFMDYIDGAELIIHNAPFDIGFLDHELRQLPNKPFEPMASYCAVIDSLLLARHKHPGQKNNLDALCKRYGVDNSQRDLHGALLDSEILADVYLLMTGGQTKLSLSPETDKDSSGGSADSIRRVSSTEGLVVLNASQTEITAHQEKLEQINSASQGACLWLKEE